MFGVAKAEPIDVGSVTLKGAAGGAGGQNPEQEGCQACQSSDNGGNNPVCTSCAYRGCLEQACQDVVGDHAEFSGKETAQRSCSAPVRLAAPGNDERARTTHVGSQHDADPTLHVSDAAPDTTLSRAAAVTSGESAVGAKTTGRPRRDKRGTKIWGSVQLRMARVCCNPLCTRRSTKGCACDEFCTNKGGKESGVLMCRRCFRDPFYHEQAAAAYFRGYSGQRRRKPLEWLPVCDAVSATAPPPVVPRTYPLG